MLGSYTNTRSVAGFMVDVPLNVTWFVPFEDDDEEEVVANLSEASVTTFGAARDRIPGCELSTLAGLKLYCIVRNFFDSSTCIP